MSVPRYRVELMYFRTTGRFYGTGSFETLRQTMPDIWDEVVEMRMLGALPQLRPKSGRRFYIVITVAGPPGTVPCLLIPPVIGDDDHTPIRVPEDPYDAPKV